MYIYIYVYIYIYIYGGRRCFFVQCIGTRCSRVSSTSSDDKMD